MTVQVPVAKEPARAVVWVEAGARVEAEWADLLQQGQAEIASVQTAEQQSLMLPGSPAIRKAVQSVVRK